MKREKKNRNLVSKKHGHGILFKILLLLLLLLEVSFADGIDRNQNSAKRKKGYNIDDFLKSYEGEYCIKSRITQRGKETIYTEWREITDNLDQVCSHSTDSAGVFCTILSWTEEEEVVDETDGYEGYQKIAEAMFEGLKKLNELIIEEMNYMKEVIWHMFFDNVWKENYENVTVEAGTFIKAYHTVSWIDKYKAESWLHKSVPGLFVKSIYDNFSTSELIGFKTASKRMGQCKKIRNSGR